MTEQTVKYYTQFNGDTPFRVEICKNIVNVFSSETDNHLTTHIAKTVFVGESPKNQMTTSSQGHGPEFLGNSILIELGDNRYEFIGMELFSFSAFSKITHFVSPVGNSLVPYPYAIDVNGNIYLMIEQVVLGEADLSDPDNDPYSYYYKKNLIGDFYMDENLYSLKYCAFPEKNYERMIQDLGKHMYIVDANNDQMLTTKEAYVGLINEFGHRMSFKPFLNTVKHT